MTLAELNDRRLLRRRLTNLAITCVVVLAIFALGSCGDLSDSEIESSVTRETTTTVRVRIAALDGGPVVFPTVPTTTVVPATTVPAPTVPPPSEPPSTTVAPPALTAPAPSPGGSCSGWGDLVASLWPAEQVATSCRILTCESQGNPRAYNPSGASGLYQIMPLWAEDFERVTGQPYYDGRFDPYANASFARWLWGQSGWQPWSCR